MAGNTPIKEKIDGRILRMLNLEDIFDIDYDTYFTLIKEKLVEANIRTKKIPVEEVMLLQQELKRIKQKIKKGGRFKPEKKKISLSGLKTLNFKQEKKNNISLPQASLVERGPEIKNLKSIEDDQIKSEDNSDIYQSIIKSLDNIAKILSEQFKFEQKNAEKQRKLNETEGRKSKEDKLESSFSKGIEALTKVAGKVFSPLQDFFSGVLDFLTRLFFAKVVSKFIDWFSDPKNKSKVETLGKIVEKFWPTILAGLVFLNPLGKLVAKAGVILVKGTAKLATIAIPAITKFIKAKGLGGAIGRAAGAVGTSMALSAAANSGKDNSNVKPIPDNQGPQTTSPNNNSNQKQEVPQETPQYKKGGKITTNTGDDIRGAGVDTQLIAARPGEVVINKETVDAVGADYFLGLNKQYGGPNANKPKLAKNVQTASGGGLVLPAFSSGGIVGSTPKQSPDNKALEKKRESGTSKEPSGGSELKKLDFSSGAKPANAARGMCTTGVILTGEKNRAKIGAPNVFTSNDPNNPRGLMAQAVKNMGYGSIPGLGKPRKVNSPYGNVSVNSMSWSEWGDAVIGGKIPSGSLVFSTERGWDYGGGSRGNDSAIAQDGGKKLWSGHWQYTYPHKGGTIGGVYGPATKEVVALTHPAGNSSGADTSTSGKGTDTSGKDSPSTETTTKSEDKKSEGPKLTFDMLYGALTGKSIPQKSGSDSQTSIGTTQQTTTGTTQQTTTGTTQQTTTGTTQQTSTGTTQQTSTGTTQQSTDSNVVQGSSADTGSGWTVKGLKDEKGRPAIFSKGGAEAFSRMMKDSGGIVKGKDIASSQRSPQKNAAVNGVPNSKHLKGNALDIHGSSQTWMRANGKKYGWFINDYPGSHGGHFDYKGPAAGSGGASAPKKEGQEQQSDQTKNGGAPPKTSGGGSISGTGVAKGVSIAKKLIGDLNIGPAAAAGIVGNLMLESALQPDNVENGKGFKDGAINNIPPGTQRVGYGWGQWTNDRLERFRKFLKDRKADNRPATDDDNYAYLINELTTTEKIKGHWKGWQGKNIPEDDPKKAATWFMMNWERPGVPHEDKRHKYAADIFSQIKGISAGTKSSEDISSSSDSGSSSQTSNSTSSTSSDSSKSENTEKKTGLTFDMLYGAMRNKFSLLSGTKGSSSPSGGTTGSSSPSGGTTGSPSPSGGTTGSSGSSGGTTGSSGSSGGTTGSSGSSVVPKPTHSGSEIDKMSIEQLRTMLDPTKPGASNEAVFNAAKQARQKAISEGLSKEEVERRVLVASVKAKQGISPSTSTIANANFISKSGPIKENTGIPAPGGGADRRIITTPSGQTIRTQPGEYILTAASVTRLGGVEKLNQLLANLDKSSNPAKMGRGAKDISQGIRPYEISQSGKVSIETLPMSGLGGMGGKVVSTNNNGSELPFHSPVSQEGMSERQRMLDVIGATAFA